MEVYDIDHFESGIGMMSFLSDRALKSVRTCWLALANVAPDTFIDMKTMDMLSATDRLSMLYDRPYKIMEHIETTETRQNG